ncbi:hypothetical protein LIER_09849 [Lithospermum erythrorhizon]|uniref:Uncharacterized protein n=1 Tax=Lithospermum erythrorhizon TaxID=34254 RepID=A0AAV3PJ67_LITER
MEVRLAGDAAEGCVGLTGGAAGRVYLVARLTGGGGGWPRVAWQGVGCRRRCDDRHGVVAWRGRASAPQACLWRRDTCGGYLLHLFVVA